MIGILSGIMVAILLAIGIGVWYLMTYLFAKTDGEFKLYKNNYRWPQNIIYDIGYRSGVEARDILAKNKRKFDKEDK